MYLRRAILWKEVHEETYHGAGRIIVKRSHNAMDTRTVFVGEAILGLEREKLFIYLKKRIKPC